jgi:biopolymer transport protein ExbD
MRLDPPPRRTLAEPLLPMINVVFLLLIFFLIVARTAPPAPVPIDLPKAVGQAVNGDIALYLAADGRLAHGKALGDAALAALAETRSQACPAPCAVPPDLMLHVDAQATATSLAVLMSQLAGMGWADVHLITATP